MEAETDHNRETPQSQVKNPWHRKEETKNKDKNMIRQTRARKNIIQVSKLGYIFLQFKIHIG